MTLFDEIQLGESRTLEFKAELPQDSSKWNKAKKTERTFGLAQLHAMPTSRRLKNCSFVARGFFMIRWLTQN